MKRPIALITLIFLLMPAFAQDVPANVKATFDQKYPGASNVEWNMDKNDDHEASFTWNGRALRADFQANGRWIETEESIDYNDLPAPVKEFVQKYYANAKISEVEKVEHHSKGVFYDVEISTGNRKLDLMIDASGSPIKN